MSRKTLLSIALLCTLGLLAGAVGVSAHRPHPQGVIREDDSLPLPPGAEEETRVASGPNSAADLHLSATEAADVALGEPGLSFRYVETFGHTGEPYLADTDHLNFPDGIFVDAGDNLWVTERHGARVLKFGPNGNHALTLGKAGYRVDDDDAFNEPADVAVDGSGNIWVVDRGPDRVVKLDSSGNYLSQLGEDWTEGTDNAHFRNPRSVAFDEAGNIYVADHENHRVQVFDGSGTYSQTLGVTAESGSDNSHFDAPAHVALDSRGNLYVSDSGNHRIQVFDSNMVYSETLGGSPGTGNYQFELPWQVAIDDNDNVYVADIYNHRVQIFDSSLTYVDTLGQTGVSGSNNSTFRFPQGVAVDSNSNVYVSDMFNHRVQKFDSDLSYVNTIGTTSEPYETDDRHYNAPYGVAVDGSGNIFVTEDVGYRLIKLNAAGVPQWTVGEAGVYGTDDAHFGGFWDGPLAVAVDGDGNAYVADTRNHRIQKCSSDGVCSTFAGHTGQSGNGDEYFTGPQGVAVDSSGNVYVGDTWNARVKRCTPGGVCSTFAGVADEEGDDNEHFDGPTGIAVDSDDNVYVADSDNGRVQKCAPDGTCSTFVEASGGWGDRFDQFSALEDVAVDSRGRVYVADIYNQRVQVFDSSGAYLTTIGGQWGSDTGELRHAAGVAVDDQGNVYIADEINARVQKFASGVPGWRQTNVNGFGYRTSYLVGALVPFDNQLYGGMYNPDTGAQLWRRSPGASWTAVFTDGLGDSSNVAVDHMIVFEDNLYLGTWNETESGSNGGQIWRSDTGDANASDWSLVAGDGFTSTNNSEVFGFAAFDNELYAATWNPTTGGELWRSSSGDVGSWAPVVTGGFNDADNNVLVSLTEFEGTLYAGTANEGTGTEVWRSASGASGDWTQVNSDGFGDAYNRSVTLEPFDGYLYAGIFNYTESNDPGAELWRCQACDGTDWEQVPIAKGFGDAENRAIRSLVAFDDTLYAFTLNVTTGMEVWRTTDGTAWKQVGPDGLGDSNNYSPYWDNSTTVFNDTLYVGTWNPANGGEVWQMLQQVFLPAVLRNVGGETQESITLSLSSGCELNSSTLCGALDSGGTKHGRFVVGDSPVNKGLQLFLTYDISSLPADAEIVDVVVDLTGAEVVGAPFDSLGCVGMYADDYGDLDSATYVTGVTGGAMAEYCSEASLSTAIHSSDAAAALQSKLGATQFQVRFQFANDSDDDDTMDWVSMESTQPSITIHYKQ